MIRFMPESSYPCRAMPDGELTIPVRATMTPTVFIRLINASHLGIRHQTLLDSDKVPGMLLSIKGMIRGTTGMMMVTRLWREPGTQDMNVWCPRVRSDPGWDLASYRHMMPTTNLT